MPSKLPESYYQSVFQLGADPDCLPANFAVVTAYHPMDSIQPECANKTADEALKARLIESGFDPFRVTGSSPDLKHSEPGWGFEADQEVAIALAREFDQRAVWLIQNDDLYLVSCVDPCPELVGKFPERLLAR